MTDAPSASSTSCPSNLALDEWLAGELSAEHAQAIEAHVRGCERCRDRRAERERERASFLAAAPTFADHAALVGHGQAASRAGGRRPRRASWWAGGALATVAAAAVVLLVLRPASDPSGDRIKGSAHLTMFVQHDGHVRRGQTGERVQPGDRLRFAYTSSEAHHLAIVGIDARRSASRYFPGVGGAAPLPAGTGVALDFAVELDGVLGREIVHGLFCRAPVDVDGVVRALGQTGRLPALPGCTVDTIVLEKDPRR